MQQAVCNLLAGGRVSLRDGVSNCGIDLSICGFFATLPGVSIAGKTDCDHSKADFHITFTNKAFIFALLLELLKNTC